MSEFKFSAAVTPQTPIRVELTPSRVAESRSEAERIESARATCMQLCREANAVGATFGQQFQPHFYMDPKGFGSAWLARHLYFLSELIETCIGGKLLPLGESGSYNQHTGIFESLGLSLFDLTVAYKLRIKELGISQAMLEEWASTVHPIAEENEFYALSFTERMATFREKA